MRSLLLFEKNLMRRTLFIALAATLVAGCASTERVAQSPRLAEAADRSGPAGPAGAMDEQGYSGAAGAHGAGLSEPGPRGAVGSIGLRSPAARGGAWRSYHDYSFDDESSDDIVRSDGNKAGEVADYINRNPSARIAIDGHNPRRVGTVRSALIDAGVPAYKIQTGAYGDPQSRRNDRVTVLVTNY